MTRKTYKNTDIEEEIGFHKTEWAAQKIGRALMMAFLLAAGLGLFGAGVLSKDTAQAGALQVEYERFGRMQRDSVFEIKMAPVQGVSGKKLWISADFLKGIKLENVSPAPSAVRADTAGQTYLFESDDNETVTVFFFFRPERAGIHRLKLRANDAELSLKQIIYP